MSGASREDPLLGFNFLVSVTDSQSALSSALSSFALAVAGAQATAGFSEVSGLEATMEVETYESGGLNAAPLRFPGRIKWANLVLRRGVLANRPLSDNTDFWSWLKGYLNGNGTRKDGTISLLDETGNPALIWAWTRGLPVRWTGPAMNAQQSQVAIEQVEIAHEGLTLVQGGTGLSAFISGAVNVGF
jgi:phage tail-like protein